MRITISSCPPGSAMMARANAGSSEAKAPRRVSLRRVSGALTGAAGLTGSATSTLASPMRRHSGICLTSRRYSFSLAGAGIGSTGTASTTASCPSIRSRVRLASIQAIHTTSNRLMATIASCMGLPCISCTISPGCSVCSFIASSPGEFVRASPACGPDAAAPGPCQIACAPCVRPCHEVAVVA